MYFLAIFVVPILILFFLEILFTTAHFFSKSKYFENKIENRNQRNVLPYEIVENKKAFFSNDKPIKMIELFLPDVQISQRLKKDGFVG